MKNKGLKLLALTIVVCSLFNVNTKAQEIKLGGGLVIETDIPPLGLQFKGTYGMDMLLENLSGSLEFAILFPANKTTYDHNRWSIDFDGNYVFWNAAGFDFYGVAGLNITHYARKSNVRGIPDNIGTKPGLNLGGGIEYAFNPKLSGFSEVKGVLGSYGQVVFNFGVLFAL